LGFGEVIEPVNAPRRVISHDEHNTRAAFRCVVACGNGGRVTVVAGFLEVALFVCPSCGPSHLCITAQICWSLRK
jgi:hypothetical protein